MELLQGRPQDETGRPQKEIRTYDLLDSLGIPFVRVDHEVHNTMESCAQVDELLQIAICKNLFLCNRQETSFYLLMMPGEKPFKTKDLSRQLGVARLSFGKPEYMEQFLDITPGSVSVMGLMNDKEHRVQLLIDEDLLRQSVFAVRRHQDTVRRGRPHGIPRRRRAGNALHVAGLLPPDLLLQNRKRRAPDLRRLIRPQSRHALDPVLRKFHRHRYLAAVSARRTLIRPRAVDRRVRIRDGTALQPVVKRLCRRHQDTRQDKQNPCARRR